MKPFVATVFITLFGTVGGLVQAQVPSGPSAVEGLGLRACSNVTAAQRDDAELYRAFAVWLDGFISAANAYEVDTFDLTPWQPSEMSIAQVVQFCDANPDRRMAEAAASYLAFLRQDRLTEPSDLVSLRNGETAVFVYQVILDRIRTKLRDAGLLGATAGDTFDTDFGTALLEYQSQNDLARTGLPDTQTLINLFR